MPPEEIVSGAAHPASPDTPDASLTISEALAQLKAERKTAEQATPSDQPESDEAEPETDTPTEDPSDGEVEGDESDAEEPDESEDADDDTEDPLIELDGEDQAVALSELKKGYLRQRDYTRKAQDLAEKRKAFDQQQKEFQSQAETFGEERNRYATITTQYGQALEHLQSVLDEGDKEWEDFEQKSLQTVAELEKLAEEDFQEYTRKNAAYQRKFGQYQFHLKQKAALKAERERHAKELDTERQKAIDAAKSHLRTHFSTNERYTSWTDKAAREAGISAMVDYAKSAGFTDQELENIYDHRYWDVLHDAAKQRALEGKAAKVKAGDPKPRPAPIKTVKAQAPRPSVHRIQSAQLQELRQRAEQSGSTSDVLALMKAEKAAAQPRRR